MNTSTTSTPSIDDKVTVLASVFVHANEKESQWAMDFYADWNVTLPLAFSVFHKFVSGLTDIGNQNVVECYSALAETLDMSEQDLSDYLLHGVV
jgi:hypothetical protein